MKPRGSLAIILILTAPVVLSAHPRVHGHDHIGEQDNEKEIPVNGESLISGELFATAFTSISCPGAGFLLLFGLTLLLGQQAS